MAPNELTTFICLFHHPDRAEEALNALESAGFNRNAITSTWKKNGESRDTDNRDTNEYKDELTQLGVPDRDLDHLRDGLAKGGVVLSLEAAENRSDEIERIFHRYSADKIDETDGERAAPPVTGSERARVADDAVVDVVAEELVVGKREVDRGGVRVFRRVVEEPVNESVNLHEEHVVIDRRPVDRDVTDADYKNAGQTLELNETEEVPVVSKVARVVEEVRVGMVESDHTETVKDTVRHTEVNVEQVAEGTAADTPNANKSNKAY